MMDAKHRLCLLIGTGLPKHNFPRCVCMHPWILLVGIPKGGIDTVVLLWHIQALHVFSQAMKECVFYIHTTGINKLCIQR
jgi:hypothetical protein